MPLALPTTLTPSKVTAFTNCPLAFRYSVIDRLPEPPSPYAVKGTLVHRALQLLFSERVPGTRTTAAAHLALDAAWGEMLVSEDLTALELTTDELALFRADAGCLVDGYLALEDPNSAQAIGLELDLRVEMDGMTMRGIIDRLDRLPSGELAVVDYKTGRAPFADQSRARMAGVHFYAYLCEQVIGVRPVSIRLMYLREPVEISAEPSEQMMRGLRQRAGAVWQAVVRACAQDDFRPHPSALCNSCGYRAYCPAVGGDPQLAADLLARESSSAGTAPALG
jgi:putative RecB family exonuclease